MSRNNQERRKEYYRKFRKKYYRKNREIILKYNKEYKKNNREEILKKDREYKRKIKKIVFNHYGGIPPRCACCGIDDLRVLTIDHINNDGAEHRRKIAVSGSSLYQWLIRNNFPEGFQVLCRNCNWTKRMSHHSN